MADNQSQDTKLNKFGSEQAILLTTISKIFLLNTQLPFFFLIFIV